MENESGGAFASKERGRFDLNAFSRLMREQHPELKFGALELILKPAQAASVPSSRAGQEGLQYILAASRKVLLKNQSFTAGLADTPLPTQCACQHLEMWHSSFEPPKLQGSCPPVILKTAILESSQAKLDKFCQLTDLATLRLHGTDRDSFPGSNIEDHLSKYAAQLHSLTKLDLDARGDREAHILNELPEGALLDQFVFRFPYGLCNSQASIGSLLDLNLT